MVRRCAFILPLLLLLLVGVMLLSRKESQSRATSATTTGKRAATVVALNRQLAEWSNPERTRKEPTAQELPALLEMAKERSAAMKRLISTAPEQALAAAISPARYEALPEELKPWFERPFAQTATLRVLPICAPGGDHGRRACSGNGRPDLDGIRLRLEIRPDDEGRCSAGGHHAR